MSQSFNNDTALRSEGRGPTQGQGQGQRAYRFRTHLFYASPDSAFTVQKSLILLLVTHISRAPLVKAEAPPKGKDNVRVFLRSTFPTQALTLLLLLVDDNTRHPHLGSRVNDLPQEGGQSADPDLARHDPTHGQSDRRTRPSDTGGEHGDPQQVLQVQDPQQGQRGQWRQGGQIASDNIPGGYVEPRQADRTGCYHQGRSEHPGNSGITGTGPGAGPGRQDIPNDGPFGGKPTLPERLMGKLILFRLSSCEMSFDHRLRLQAQPKRWSGRPPVTLRCINMVKSARYVDLRVPASPTHMTTQGRRLLNRRLTPAAELIEQNSRLECPTMALL